MASSVTARVSEPNRADTEFVKDSQMVEISAEWLDSFHRDEKRDVAGRAGTNNFLAGFAHCEALRSIHFCIKPCDLIEGHRQSQLWKMSIFDIDRSAEHADSARLELPQKILG